MVWLQSRTVCRFFGSYNARDRQSAPIVENEFDLKLNWRKDVFSLSDLASLVTTTSSNELRLISNTSSDLLSASASTIASPPSLPMLVPESLSFWIVLLSSSANATEQIPALPSWLFDRSSTVMDALLARAQEIFVAPA